MPRPSRALTVTISQAGVRCRGEELARVGGDQLQQLLVDEVGLGQRDHAVPHAEQLEDREVLDGLRHHAVVGGDDQQEEVDARRAGDHGAHEALVPGHVDHAQPRAPGQRQLGVAELDGDAALLLLAQPVGVLAGEGGDERRLAVVDVPGGAERERRRGVHRTRRVVEPATRGLPSGERREHRAGELLELVVGARRAGRTAAGRRGRGRRRRASPARSRRGEAGRVLGVAPRRPRSAPRSPAARRRRRARRCRSESRRPRAGRTAPSSGPVSSARRRSARARTAPSGAASAASVGTRSRRELRVEVEPQQRVEGGEVELVDAQRARQRMPAHGVDRRGPADGDAGLRAAEQLVAAERDHVGAGGDALLQRRLLGEQLERSQGAAAEVVDEHGAALVGERRRAPPATARR